MGSTREPHERADRVHDGVLTLVTVCMMMTETICKQSALRGRHVV